MAALIATIIVYLLGWISQAILSWLSGVYTTMFYLAFAIEISFRDIATNFSISGLYNAVYIIAIAILVMFFVKKMVETYITWSNRRSRRQSLKCANRFYKSNDCNGYFWIYIHTICKYILWSI